MSLVVVNVEKEDVEMKVDIVEFVENEMVELDVVQIGFYIVTGKQIGRAHV